MVTIIFSYYGGLIHKERALGALFSEIYNKLDDYIIYKDCDPYSGILTLSKTSIAAS